MKLAHILRDSDFLCNRYILKVQYVHNMQEIIDSGVENIILREDKRYQWKDKRYVYCEETYDLNHEFNQMINIKSSIM